MGTRSTTHIFNGIISEKNHLVSTYKQFDSYIKGYGQDLYDFLSNIQLVNGYSKEHENSGYANGMGCLSAQLIKHFKNGIGGYYITNKSDIQEYNYYIYTNDSIIMVKIIYDDEALFDGTIDELVKFIKENQ